MSNTRKKKVEERFSCPWCNKLVVFEAGDDILTPAEPAEKEKYIEVRKDTQTTLDKDEKRVKRKGMKGL